MKKILVMLLVFCGLSFSQTLKFVTSPDYPPFSYMKDGKYTGVDMEILDNVAKELVLIMKLCKLRSRE